MRQMPAYLRDYRELYEKNPREANLTWFRQAGYGLFMHYGLYSILGSESREDEKIMEWVQYNRKIPVSEYAKLKDRFTAENFDADAIASFAKQCGMKYINLTTRHHDSFCLFETRHTDFNSLNSPAGRDLIRELADACERHELALFLYYSHGRDWKHPHAPNNDAWGSAARPQYDPPEPSYKVGEEHNLDEYVEFMKAQVRELLTQYPTAAGIWLDGLGVLLSGDHESFKTEELYELIRELSPHALVSYKQGLFGTEDYFAPEHKVPKKENEAGEDYQKHTNRLGKIEEHKEKLVEVCTTMIKNPVSWGYKAKAVHLTEEEVWEKLTQARDNRYNLLLNIGVMGDGGLDPIDVEVLLRVGRRLAGSVSAT
ncbi:alpha-L-fucosidase [Paenibacillus koleovorans]|uniref:alpha-L-fucosidase n=1 Tax=Paenibacillus koleovorans TaxID=121608 RepID=UPI000FDB9C78|nr:alpha-L-fucosidase [Paenibacillus koleovorans]